MATHEAITDERAVSSTEMDDVVNLQELKGTGEIALHTGDITVGILCQSGLCKFLSRDVL